VKQRADHSTDWHRPSPTCCLQKQMLPDADCDFKGVREGVAKPVPEAVSDRWAVLCGPFVLSFILTWEMKGTNSISFRELFMRNNFFFNVLFFSEGSLLLL